MRKLVVGASVAIALCTALLLATLLSPWPTVLAIRFVFDRDAARAMERLEPRLPDGIDRRRDLAYGPEARESLDLYLPSGAPPPGGWPVVVWVHGGAFVSGSRQNVGNYLQILAAEGYAAMAPDYGLAPANRHPRPAAQMLEALLWLQGAADDHGLDPDRIVLAGDSAGSHIALQTAIALHDPAYADALGLSPQTDPDSLRGLALFSGAYDLQGMDREGAFSGFLQTVLWSYLGHKAPAEAPDAALFSLFAHLPPTLPPLFVSAGNADPLLPQSTALAGMAAARGIGVDTLFFPSDHQPALGHEYQFTLDPAGEEAFARLTAFLRRVMADPLAPTATTLP